jgi:hypothetical protein
MCILVMQRLGVMLIMSNKAPVINFLLIKQYYNFFQNPIKITTRHTSFCEVAITLESNPNRGTIRKWRSLSPGDVASTSLPKPVCHCTSSDQLNSESASREYIRGKKLQIRGITKGWIINDCQLTFRHFPFSNISLETPRTFSVILSRPLTKSFIWDWNVSCSQLGWPNPGGAERWVWRELCW